MRCKVVALAQCYNCLRPRLLLSSNKQWGFCLDCHSACRVEFGMQICDPKGREVLVREMAMGVRPAE